MKDQHPIHMLGNRLQSPRQISRSKPLLHRPLPFAHGLKVQVGGMDLVRRTAVPFENKEKTGRLHMPFDLGIQLPQQRANKNRTATDRLRPRRNSPRL